MMHAKTHAGILSVPIPLLSAPCLPTLALPDCNADGGCAAQGEEDNVPEVDHHHTVSRPARLMLWPCPEYGLIQHLDH